MVTKNFFLISRVIILFPHSIQTWVTQAGDNSILTTIHLVIQIWLVLIKLIRALEIITSEQFYFKYVSKYN